MIKLYHSNGTCSNVPLIVLQELAMPYEVQRYDNKTRKFQDGTSIIDHNPGGYVPILKLDDESYLTEVAVIIQYLADQKQSLIPKLGTIERYRFMALLNILSTEIHKSFSPFFIIPRVGKDEDLTKRAKPVFEKYLFPKIQVFEDHLAKHQYLFGDEFTVADIYFYVLLGWASYANVDFTPFKHCASFSEQIAKRPSVVSLTEANLLT
ncbi:MAG: glutathione S-transferase C-terminal domain-containing protein [Methylacidiphilales bacterium]|nr:glutathione S-transferase C-terminal domain-containing protein [Candidatus Methylacidiphilales bacterium]